MIKGQVTQLFYKLSKALTKYSQEKHDNQCIVYLLKRTRVGHVHIMLCIHTSIILQMLSHRITLSSHTITHYHTLSHSHTVALAHNMYKVNHHT